MHDNDKMYVYMAQRNTGWWTLHIKGFGINNLPPLEYTSYVSCDEKVNLFIGPNATGKTTILRAIQAFHGTGSEESAGPETVEFREFRGGKGSIFLDPSDDWPRDDSLPHPDNQFMVKWGTVPLVYLPSTRVSLPLRGVIDNELRELEIIDSGAPFKELLNIDTGIFLGQNVEAAIQVIRNTSTRNNRIRAALRRALEIGYLCTRDICQEIIEDERPHVFSDLSEDDEKIIRYGMGIGTSDDILGEPIYAGELSSGTQGTLLWIYALVLITMNHYRWEEGWNQQPAILLIDEIENHLHPTWQRRVIPALLEHFPGLQIFATTHSPFVVAGLKAGQVHLLNRDQNGVVTASTNTEDIIGWTADEILRTIMGVDEPTDQLTVDRANRLRELREKDTLTTEEQDELNTLRRQVNQTFLNKSSPLEAQRERYSELMQQFLLSRQPDLSPDGG